MDLLIRVILYFYHVSDPIRRFKVLVFFQLKLMLQLEYDLLVIARSESYQFFVFLLIGLVFALGSER